MTAGTLAFRAATDEDWESIYEIFRVVTDTSDTYPYPPGMGSDDAKLIWMAPSNEIFVATVGERIVGTAYLRPNLVGLGDHVCNAGWMIHPMYEGRGVGRAFAEYVMSRARSRYAAMQFNAVVSTNKRALSLWEDLGFEIVGTIPGAFRHGTEGLTDAHIMYRKL